MQAFWMRVLSGSHDPQMSRTDNNKSLPILWEAFCVLYQLAFTSAVSFLFCGYSYLLSELDYGFIAVRRVFQKVGRRHHCISLEKEHDS